MGQQVNKIGECMNQEPVQDKEYSEGITDNDLQQMLAQNPLAAEQLRRIMAERQRAELEAKLVEIRSKSNGTGNVTELVAEPRDAST
jgi:hypothetical protein